MKKTKAFNKLFIILSLTFVLTAPVFSTSASASGGETVQLMSLLDDISIIK
jgi:hypothetical protein